MYQILAIHYSPSSGTCSAAPNVSAVFIFGDSLVDVGNNYYIDTVAMPMSPNEEDLGFENYSPPYLNPNTTGDVILKGVNYASSGAGILNSTGSVLGAPIHFDQQINYFAKTRQDIMSRIGASAAQQLLTKAIYFVAIGSNDIFGAEQEILQTLYNLDARKIIVTNAPMVGCTPFERDVHSSRDKCVDFPNEVAKSYNSRLKALLQELTTNLTGSIFVYLDAYAMSEDIFTNYKSYGFDNAEFACCQVIGEHGGLVPCGNLSRVCSDRSKYVFWDPFHPTEAVNLIMAKQALDGDINYVSPINIRQLINS
ncbi:Lipase, GDSL [Corchorus olitorius]|uniref:Lipase, GDSL n=1 Tax=Corchorus olitorius TaxID=93759 RepID=A0A1R3H653_9ROSI|nr:Lipase, GDSL [Corchorus olitorius]